MDRRATAQEVAKYETSKEMHCTIQNVEQEGKKYYLDLKTDNYGTSSLHADRILSYQRTTRVYLFKRSGTSIANVSLPKREYVQTNIPWAPHGSKVLAKGYAAYIFRFDDRLIELPVPTGKEKFVIAMTYDQNGDQGFSVQEIAGSDLLDTMNKGKTLVLNDPYQDIKGFTPEEVRILEEMIKEIDEKEKNPPKVQYSFKEDVPKEIVPEPASDK
ncbi:MAG: hypothetical protein SFX18_15455 [Pirellulales bacterium]|nr:hypothetical protein [Pirellulales bacterium]